MTVKTTAWNKSTRNYFYYGRTECYIYVFRVTVAQTLAWSLNIFELGSMREN